MTDTNELRRQRKGLNPFLPDAPVRKTFTDEGVAEKLQSWADAEREKEAWRDGDTNTYRYRANLLEAGAFRLAAATARAEAAEAEAEKWRTDYARLYRMTLEPHDPPADLTPDTREELAALAAGSSVEPPKPPDDDDEPRALPMHSLTEYGTTSCPVQGVRAFVDDNECSACGGPVESPTPKDAATGEHDV